MSQESFPRGLITVLIGVTSQIPLILVSLTRRKITLTDTALQGGVQAPGLVSFGNASRDIPHAGFSLLVTTLTAAVEHAHEVESSPAAVQRHVQAWLGTTDKNRTPARLRVVAGAEDLPE